MKTFIRTPILDAKEDEAQYSEKEVSDLETAKLEKKVNEKIHLCFHDEENPKSCRLI